MLQLKAFYNIPQDDRCEVIVTEQATDIPFFVFFFIFLLHFVNTDVTIATDIPQIRVCSLLFTEYGLSPPQRLKRS